VVFLGIQAVLQEKRGSAQVVIAGQPFLAQAHIQVFFGTLWPVSVF
jgi:hypothetical protein